jgi:hypothetical protein
MHVVGSWWGATFGWRACELTLIPSLAFHSVLLVVARSSVRSPPFVATRASLLDVESVPLPIMTPTIATVFFSCWSGAVHYACRVGGACCQLAPRVLACAALLISSTVSAAATHDVSKQTI